MKIVLRLVTLWLAIPLWFGEAFASEANNGPGRWAILVSGLSGDPELQKELLSWVRELRVSLEGPLQFPKEHIFVLFDDPEKDPGIVQYKSTRENLEKVCRQLSTQVRKDDLVFVFIAGHGNFDGKAYKLNLPGSPDPTAEELASMFYAIPAQRIVVVNTTTCSGGSIAALSKKGKIVVTATKSGHEKNQTHMGQFFVQAFREGNGDTDKNGRVSLLEAFTYARQKVEEYYAKEGNLQTEHPVLDDDGDGQAQAKPGPDNGEGLLARTTFLDTGPARLAQGKMSAEEQALALEAQALEKQIEALKYVKAETPEAEYEKRLETLLLKLATVQAKLRKEK